MAEALLMGDEWVAGAVAASHAAEKRATSAEELANAAEKRARLAEWRTPAYLPMPAPLLKGAEAEAKGPKRARQRSCWPVQMLHGLSLIHI